MPRDRYKGPYGTSEDSLRLTMKRNKKCLMYTANNLQRLLRLLQPQIQWILLMLQPRTLSITITLEPPRYRKHISHTMGSLCYQLFLRWLSRLLLQRHRKCSSMNRRSTRCGWSNRTFLILDEAFMRGLIQRSPRIYLKWITVRIAVASYTQI